MAPSQSSADPARQWAIVARWQEFEGEGRVNFLRILAIVAFYLVQLIHYSSFSDRSETEREFHRYDTLLAAAWLFVSFAVLIALQRRWLPRGLKYFTTLADLLLLTGLAALGNGPASPLVNGYFLVIVSAGLRFSLPLVWSATLAAMSCYLMLVGVRDPLWFDEQHATPVVNQLVMLLSLGLTGILLGQIIRRVRSMAIDLLSRMEAKR